MLVRPSVYSDRPGVKAVEYDLRGIAPELRAVLPVFQGVRLRLDDELKALLDAHADTIAFKA